MIAAKDVKANTSPHSNPKSALCFLLAPQLALPTLMLTLHQPGILCSHSVYIL